MVVALNRLRVKIFQNRIPDYRVPFFLELVRIAKNQNIEVEIYISSRPYQKRGDEAAKYVPHTVINTLSLRIKKLNFDIFIPNLKILAADLYIVEFGIRNLFQILFLKLLGRGKLAYWGHGEERAKKFSQVNLYFRRRILSLADYYFVYTISGRDFLIEVENYPSTQIFVVNNSTDTRIIAEAKLNSFEKIPIYAPINLSVPGKFTIAAVSSLDKSKRVHEVLEIHQEMRKQIPDFQTLICGDGPERGNLERASTDGIFFLGRVSPRELAQISKTVVAIVSPGPVGLVVTDSFAMGVPIITTADQNHGPEFSYLIDGYNSLIVPNSRSEFIQAIVRIINDTDLQKTLQFGSAESLKNYNIDIMVANYLGGINSILGKTL